MFIFLPWDPPSGPYLALTEPVLATQGTRNGLAAHPEPFSGKELVTGSPPFLTACLPAPLIIALIVLRTGPARSARGGGSDGESDESVNAET